MMGNCVTNQAKNSNMGKNEFPKAQGSFVPSNYTSTYGNLQYPATFKPSQSILNPGSRFPTLPKPEIPVINKPKVEATIATKSSGLYQETLKPLLFELITDLPNSLINGKESQAPTQATKRIQFEINKFKDVLPCQSSNAIFVRVDNSRLYSMNVLISGSTDTPYANGLYLFQLYCDYFYPVQPPKMQILTGKGKVRFNPNLYREGKICLSLLGTWPGQTCEVWNSINSTLNQIFVSIQSLIMSNDIYFNEPGLEVTKGTVKGDLCNRGYGLVVKLANIRYAMIEIIKNPPKGFEEVVRKHFLLKKEEILEQCRKWLKEKDLPFEKPDQNADHEQNIRVRGFGALLEKQVEELKLVFSTLKE